MSLSRGMWLILVEFFGAHTGWLRRTVFLNCNTHGGSS